MAAFAAVTLGVADQAWAHRSPATCTTNGSGAAISKLIGSTTSVHGTELCYKVEIFNTCSGCCDITLLNTELALPDGSIIPITVGASVLFGDDFLCPGDARCATASNCTISGEVGYRYIVSHANEHGDTGGSCPPTPAAGSGEVSGFFRSTAGIVHTQFHVGASLCKAIATGVAHACCEPCTGTCTDVYTVDECPFPSVYTADKSCDELVPRCAPLDCSGFVDQCNDARCNPATGTCELVPRPALTPCEAESPPNLCTSDFCDGSGNCVGMGTNCDIPDYCNDNNVCTADRCGIDLPQCCENLPIPCPPRPCFRLTGCDPINGCQYVPDCRTGTGCCPDDGNPCTHEFCDQVTGICGATPDCTSAADCNDNSVCTTDTCENSCCVNTPIVCPARPCFRLTGCDPINGCQYVPDCRTGTGCCPDDGNPCTHEFCDQVTGLCGSTPDCTTDIDCNDNSVCTTDTCVNSCCVNTPIECPPRPCFRLTGCDPINGCQYVPDCRTGTGCCPDDGDPCTIEQCDVDGQCVVLIDNCGACCDTLNGVCSERILEADCLGDQRVWTRGATCAEVTCDPEPGACCDQDVFGTCTETTVMECNCTKCVWHKLQTCAQIECTHAAIPTVSQWGLVVLALLLLTGAKIYFGRRQVEAA